MTPTAIQPGVTEPRQQCGGVALAPWRREIGRLHGLRIADRPFPRAVRDELIATGRTRPHHAVPDGDRGTRNAHAARANGRRPPSPSPRAPTTPRR